MSVETPQPQDRVRWTRTSVIDGVVEEVQPDAVVIRADDGRHVLCQFEEATVEVLERADDPRGEHPGAVRTSPAGAQYVRVDAREGVDPWVYLSGGSGVQTQFPRVDDRIVVGWPRGEPVAGSPAAEARREQQVDDALPDWERELIEKESAARLLRVHPHVWQSLTHYLASTRIRVTEPDGDGVWGMELMDGEWP